MRRVPPTILVNGHTAALPPGAETSGGDVWLPTGVLEAVTGWELKPEGACLGDVCVAIPRGREDEFVRGERFNITALARHLGQPIVHDPEHEAWVLGESAETRVSALRSLQAPDFTLPDLDGRPHSLLDYLGRKVFLVSWASW